MGGQGGGGSGKVDYPDYMEAFHQSFLTNVLTEVLIANTANPYATIAAYDPDAQISSMFDVINTYGVHLSTYLNAYMPSYASKVATLDTFLTQMLNTYANTFSNSLDTFAVQVATLGTQIDTISTGIGDLGTYADVLDLKADTLDTHINELDDVSLLEDEAEAYGGILKARIDSDTIPAFEAGMRDINAVQSSAFIIGKALLYARKDDQVAQYLADLGGKFRHQIGELRIGALNARSRILELRVGGANVDLKVGDLRVSTTTLNAKVAELRGALLDARNRIAQFRVAYTGLYIDDRRLQTEEYRVWLDGARELSVNLFNMYRMSLIAKKEEHQEQIEIDTHQVTWILDVYDHGGNMLSKIGGGHGVGPSQGRPSKTQTALGGAISGAGAGAMIGSAVSPGAGTAVGAAAGFLVGGVGGYFLA